MGTITKLEVKNRRNAAESTIFGLECDVRQLGELANERAPFFPQEIQELRRAASDLLMIAGQIEMNQRFGR